MANQTKVQLTEGNIIEKLLSFVWPLLLAQIFQQLYSLTNSAIVGNYVSIDALSAVSACNSICNVYNFLFHGLGMGAGIVIATYYGANDKRKAREAIDSCIGFAIIGGIILTILSEFLIPFFLDVSNVKVELYASALSYLRVYVLGSSAVLTYEMSFFALRSMGDTKHPLYYLIMSCTVNLVLGILFVRVFHLDVVGTAIATITAQFLVDFFSLRLLKKIKDAEQLEDYKFHINWTMIKKICSLGIPTGIQNMLIAVGAMMIQSYTNQFPNAIIAGIGVAEKVAVFANIPMQSVSTVTITMVSQNMGAQKYDRVKQIIKNSVWICTSIQVICSTLLFITAPFWVKMFNPNADVVAAGSTMIRCVVYSYIPLSLSHVFHGAIRGAGNVKVPMFIAVISQCVFRYLYVFIGLKIFYSPIIIYTSGALGFTIAGIVATLYFYNSKWTKAVHLR